MVEIIAGHLIVLEPNSLNVLVDCQPSFEIGEDRLRDLLENELREKGRWDIAREDCVLAREVGETKERINGASWKRFASRKDLSPRELTVISELCMCRERIAERRHELQQRARFEQSVREWLANDLRRARLGYVKRDNCFVDLKNPQRAQEIFSQQLHTDWPKRLDEHRPWMTRRAANRTNSPGLWRRSPGSPADSSARSW